MFVKGPQLFYEQVVNVFGLAHFLFHYLPYDFESRGEISFRGKDCNTLGVLNTKTCHVIICIAHHLCVSKNFDMHTLKQAYLYVVCVELYCLNQVQSFAWI